ncbi:protein FAM234B [Gadus morhua]|uniref:Family with sequence similarity 234 member B n=1 Tax=Gadus morhua TaxID=8049 RepID=A0A8C4Z6E3_GADMO|nr:protein FAM234B [Gadus morhua]
MAAALSRALKLPGKKGSQLGEYDPLTQADSEDESEEDDLVLNYPRNGLARAGCLGPGPSDPQGGRPRRLDHSEDEAEEEEEEEEERKSMQYWSQREDGEGEGGGGGGGGGSGGEGAGPSGSQAERKRKRERSAMRAAFFLVPLVLAMLMVLLCAFLIPCQKAERQPQWERPVGEAGGVTPPALALWDVDGDAVEDVLLGETERTNDTHPLQGTKVYSAVALSATSGQVLWRHGMRESVLYIQCGLQYQADPVPLPAGGAALRAYPETAPLLVGQRERASGPVCLLITKKFLTAVNGTTGKQLWSVLLESIESQAVLLPDLQGDTVPDLLVATLPADQVSDLSLTLLSGLTGAKLGRPVTFNLTAQGKLIGPLLHQTQHGAYYILFGLGTVEAVSLSDIYLRAKDEAPLSDLLRQKEADWERLKKTNSSSFLHLYSGTEQVDFLLPMSVGFSNNHNSLDSGTNRNWTRGDWALVYGASKLSVLRERDAHREWILNEAPIHSQPVSGHFNGDGIPDLFIQHSADGVRKVQIVDGAKGKILWKAEFLCPRLVLEASAIQTTMGLSSFLFWASQPLTAKKSPTKTTVAPGVASAEPLIRNLFLLHPTYPTILLQLASTTDTAVAGAVSYQEPQRDASYITVSSRPALDSEPGAQVVKRLSLKDAMSKAQTVRLNEGSGAKGPSKPGAFELKRFFRQLGFRPQ